MNQIMRISGKGLSLPGEDIDTDRIIPARFLKEITFENMGKYAFYDARFDTQGQPLEHPFNNKKFKNANVLIAGRNFGCGSSREHAPQALKRFGIHAIIAVSFAEIFRGNCKAIGLPTATLSESAIASIQAEIDAHPETAVSLDLAEKTLHVGKTQWAVEIPESHHQAFLSGTWDAITTLKENMSLIYEKHRTLPY